MQHLFSLITAIVITLNLGILMVPIVILGALKAISPSERLKITLTHATEAIYRLAAAVHTFWMLYVVRINITVKGELPDHDAPIIISNHQSWMDIPVLHGVITWDGPILKFLIKKELLWVPIVGWICYALGFPALRRGQGSDAREKDYAAIQSFSSSLHQERGALLIFAEGTRFTPLKHRNQKSPYTHLLTPRPGGLKIALETTPPNTPIVDVTIVYHGDNHFWRCLGGSTKNITVHLRTYDSNEVNDVREWLDDRWTEKDGFF